MDFAAEEREAIGWGTYRLIDGEEYVEGVVLSDNLEALFRNVPPPLSLALAMTEKHEKAERAAIMRDRKCSELEAVYAIAERIAAHRGN